MTSLTTDLATSGRFRDFIKDIKLFLFTNGHFKIPKRTLVFSFKVWKAQCLLKRDYKGRVR